MRYQDLILSRANIRQTRRVLGDLGQFGIRTQSPKRTADPVTDDKCAPPLDNTIDVPTAGATTEIVPVSGDHDKRSPGPDVLKSACISGPHDPINNAPSRQSNPFGWFRSGLCTATFKTPL
jgi:hypothetical protein